jgi:hypothetical protein
MIEEFKEWMIGIQEDALARKREKAKAKGDESKWRSEIWKSPDKNRDIKLKFQLEGDKRHYKSRPSSETKAGEWLYDFVWRQFDEEGNLLCLKLAMEIEVSDMNERGIKYDFNKLLQADSDYKVLVFQLKTGDEVSSALSNFEKAAMAYNSKFSSDFLLCGWSTSLNKFAFSSFSTAP